MTESGQKAFASCIQSIVQSNAKGFQFWRDQVLSRNEEDAYQWVVRVLDAFWAQGVILNYVTYRALLQFDEIDPALDRGFDAALTSLELLLRYEALPRLNLIKAPAHKVEMPDDVLTEDSFFQFAQRQRSQASTEELSKSATRNTEGVALYYLFGRVVGDPGADERVKMDLALTASHLAHLAVAEGAELPVRVQRYRRIAEKCAAVAESGPSFNLLTDAFRSAGFSVPKLKGPQWSESGFVIEVDGTLRTSKKADHRSQVVASGGGAQTSTMPTRHGTTIPDNARKAFANLIKSIAGANPTGFQYWRGHLFDRKEEDALQWIACLLDAHWAQGVFWHYQTYRTGLHSSVFSPSMLQVFDDALSSVQRLLDYDALPQVQRIQATMQSVTMAPNVLAADGDDLQLAREGDRHVIDALVGHANENAGQTAMISLFSNIFTDPDPTPPQIRVDLTTIARQLAVLSRGDETDFPDRARRCRRLAGLCAAASDRDAVEFGNLVEDFRFAMIPVPREQPIPYAPPEFVIEVDGSIRMAGDSRSVGSPSTAPVGAEDNTEVAVRRAMRRSLHGLVGLDHQIELFAMDVFEFLNGPKQSRGRLFWGAPGVGKTEFAQRLAGLRDGFPALSLPRGTVNYVSGVDGRLEIKKLVDEADAYSILFVDEADKCLDPNAGMVSAADAKQVCHAIITHFQRKPILWVFLGVFSGMRVDGGLTDQSVAATFGDELAHRLDYADWQFPTWTLPNLLKAVGGSRKLEYDEKALVLLADYCIRTNGGVRSFDNLEAALLRHLRVNRVDSTVVTVPLAREILAKRGVV